MTDLFSIDPGADKLGIAYFQDGILRGAATLHGGAQAVVTWIDAWGVDKYDLVTERMHKREGQTVFNENLDKVEDTRLEILRLLRRKRWTRTYKPTEWKGSIPKKIHHGRLERVLHSTEKWPRGHDARDAVGIGLYHLKRVKRGGIKA